jgi:hypothetical protein
LKLEVVSIQQVCVSFHHPIWRIPVSAIYCFTLLEI